MPQTKTAYAYHDPNGALAYTKVRLDLEDGSKSFFFLSPDGTKGVKGIPRVPYHLPEVLAADTAYIVEGEKCADRLRATGRCATTLDGGAKSPWRTEYATCFAGKEIVILPDNDAPGMGYATMLKRNLPEARIVTLPGLEDKGDVFDWLEAGHTLEELDTLPEYVIPAAATPDTPKEKAPTQAKVLLGLIDEAGVEFFHSETRVPYAAIPVADHVEIWPLECSEFKFWMQNLYYRQIDSPVGTEAVGQAIATLSGRALFDGPEFKLHTRLAQPAPGVIWYDLSSPNWQAVRLTKDGWKVRDDPPVLFVRYRHQAAQVTPKPGGDIRKILKHINLKHSQTLFLCWLVSCFIPDIPHAMPIFYGEKGAAKSTVSGFLKLLIDPSELETLTLQKDERTLVINLAQHWFLPFDNVSHINEETSDTLCRAITGGGIQQRKLFTNAEDVVFNFKRCLAINGINNVATRPDLLDRSLLVELDRIPEGDRRELSEVRAAFEADRPEILGGIFDTLVAAMNIFPSVKLSHLPRMADFARWGYAIGEALGGLGQEFLDQYAANRDSQNTEAINSDPVATLVVEFMKDKPSWSGRISDLLKELMDISYLHGIGTRSRTFPTQPNQLSRRLRGMKSNLEAIGIAYGNGGHGRQGTVVSLRKEKLSSQPSSPSSPYSRNCFSRDDGVTKNGDNKTSSQSSSHLNPLVLKGCDGGDDCDDVLLTLRQGVI